MADTEANREAQAARYLVAVPVRGLIRDMAENLGANLPAAEASVLERVLDEFIDYAALEQATLNALVEHFTAEELRALADFYGSPTAQSAMRKFGVFMADAMPHIQQEVQKALQRAKEEGLLPAT